MSGIVPRPSVPRKPQSVRSKIATRQFARVRLHLYLPKEERKTDLAKITCETQLPQCVKVLQSFDFPGCAMKLKQNDILMLHFIDPTPVVFATDSDKKKYRLPVFAKQQYEMLPLDPRLDDKEFIGTESLMNSNPLPQAVRVAEAHYSGHEDEGQEEDDVIYIKGVEIDEERGKVLVGMSGEFEVRFSTGMDTSVYTTMISSDFLPLSQIIKHKMPQRVRLPDTSKGLAERNRQNERVFRLHDVINENRVISTRGKDAKVFIIPLKAPISMERTEALWRNIQDLVSPLFPLVNTSFDLPDVTQAMLPHTFQAIPQPLKLTLDRWLSSWEGKMRADGVANQRNGELQKNLVDLKKELDKMRSTCTLQMYEANMTSDVPPERLPRNTALVLQAVPEGKSNAESRTRLPKDGPLTLGSSATVLSRTGPNSPDIVRPPPQIPNTVYRTRVDDSDSDSDSYLDDYEEVGDIQLIGQRQQMSNVPPAMSNEQIQQFLKQLLSKKEHMLVETKSKLKALSAKYEELLKGKTKIKEERDNHMKTIEHLQHIIDEHDVYDLLTPEMMTRERVGAGLSTDVSVPTLPRSPTRLDSLNVREVVEFLKGLHLGQYTDSFIDNDINGTFLLAIDEDIMITDLGMTKLHARKLFTELSKPK